MLLAPRPKIAVWIGIHQTNEINQIFERLFGTKEIHKGNVPTFRLLSMMEPACWFFLGAFLATTTLTFGLRAAAFLRPTGRGRGGCGRTEIFFFTMVKRER